MHTGLERVLMCYVCYRPDVGYVQVRTQRAHIYMLVPVFCGDQVAHSVMSMVIARYTVHAFGGLFSCFCRIMLLLVMLVAVR
jgi:hypothetical protein